MGGGWSGILEGRRRNLDICAVACGSFDKDATDARGTGDGMEPSVVDGVCTMLCGATIAALAVLVDIVVLVVEY